MKTANSSVIALSNPCPEADPLDFAPAQIVCLEDAEDLLYCEVIQTVPERQICWARPLVLMSQNKTELLSLTQEVMMASIIDVRQTADLIWPIAAFRAAWDTEILPLLQVLTHPVKAELQRTQHHFLQDFVARCWQSHFA